MTTTREMSTKEYKQMCQTGSSEPERRKSQVIYEPAAKRPEGVKGYHLCKRGDEPKGSKPKLRIAHIPKNGSPRLVAVKEDLLTRVHTAPKPR